ncbi:MAG: DUF3048 domain-containing protein [Oscillospiraceae bacterium]|nr:DUF3048 domain-containing protein [Oscillospiraceae bacterium]
MKGVFIIKKITAFILAMVMAFSMTACSSGDSSSQDITGESQSTSASEGTQTESTVPVEEREYNYITGDALNGKSTTDRPVAIMVDNSKFALPQYGISSADIIYEMVTEGGITRLMAVYSDIDNVQTVGPVRSARDQFVQFVLPLNAIYVHIGTSRYAYDMLNLYHYQDIDGLYLGVTSFDFDREREKTYAHEHCWFTKSNLIRDGISAAAINTSGNLYPAFNFADYRLPPVELTEGSEAKDISVNFSDYCNVSFHYNKKDKKYYKDTYGSPHMDAATDTQLSFSNVLLLNTTVGLYADKLCSDYDFTQGEGYYFYGGRYIPVKWEKGAPENPLYINDLDGNPIEINVGKTYVGIYDNSMTGSLRFDAEETQSADSSK